MGWFSKKPEVLTYFDLRAMKEKAEHLMSEIDAKHELQVWHCRGMAPIGSSASQGCGNKARSRDLPEGWKHNLCHICVDREKLIERLMEARTLLTTVSAFNPNHTPFAPSFYEKLRHWLIGKPIEDS